MHWKLHIEIHIQISPDQLRRSRITQYHWGYCKCSFNLKGTMRVLCSCCHSSIRVPSQSPQRLQAPQRYCIYESYLAGRIHLDVWNWCEVSFTTYSKTVSDVACGNRRSFIYVLKMNRYWPGVGGHWPRKGGMGMCGPEDPLFTPLLPLARVPFQAKESVHKTPLLRKFGNFSLNSLNFHPNFSSQAPKFGNFQLTSP